MKRLYYVDAYRIGWEVEVSGDETDWVAEFVGIDHMGSPDLYDVLEGEVQEAILREVQLQIDEGERLLV